MVARIMSGFSHMKDRVVYVGIIAALICVVRLGHATHWEFGTGRSLAEEASSQLTDVRAADSQSQVVTAAKPNERPVSELKITNHQLTKSQIELEVVTERPIDQVIRVNGVVTYDQDHVAQLSVRVPGNVWRVEKRVGQFESG